ncbi:hypothetical protein G3M48_010179 [Beauveria asiatica]|uniref:Uncharacterized protein n=1 Tax=Beauveria asiatica TaxID=1069075 RepID=A0AAW0S1F0_9HYPO
MRFSRKEASCTGSDTESHLRGGDPVCIRLPVIGAGHGRSWTAKGGHAGDTSADHEEANGFCPRQSTLRAN